MSAKTLTFYSSRICPWAARTWIALEQAGAKYDLKEIDLSNKPDYFLKVSSTGKVPTLVVDDNILIESAITTRYVAEEFPKAELLSSNPLLNAQSELWADRYINLVAVSFFYKVKNYEKADLHDKFFDALDQALPFLIKAGPFAAGSSKPLIGDALVAPFVGRIHLHLEKGVLPSSISEKLNSDAKYSDYLKYVDMIFKWPAFAKINDPEAIFEGYLAKFA